MNKASVVTYLRAVNEVLSRKHQQEKLVVIGGAALALSFPEFSRPVTDVDGVNVSSHLQQAVEEVTYTLDLPTHWFHETMGNLDELHTVTLMSNLEIQAPSKDYLLCMKLRSARPEEVASDAEDVSFLISHMPNIKVPEDWQALYVKYFHVRDWKPWIAERANQALWQKDRSKAANQQSTTNPQEPLLRSRINEVEWQENPNLRITRPEDPQEVTASAQQHWGNEGAGVLFYCPMTQRVLLAHRSQRVNEPGTWGNWGGKVELGEDPQEAAQREAEEETHHTVINLEHLYDYHDGAFTYHNYIAMVYDEFTPSMNWETDGYQWVPLDNPPEPLHYGVAAVWPTLKAWVSRKQPKLGFRQASSKLQEARQWAQELFQGHTRRDGSPYFSHLEGVALLVKGCGGDEDMQIAAYLHDALEDTPVTVQDIEARFGSHVAQLVQEMTRVSTHMEGNRAHRKQMDREAYAQVSPEAQTIKLADILYNGYDTQHADPAFASIYIPELRDLAQVLTQGDAGLQRQVQIMFQRMSREEL